MCFLASNLSSKASDLGYLHPDAPESYGTGDIISTHNETVFRDVYALVNWAKDYAYAVGEVAIRDNLSLYFRGKAMT